MLKFWLAFRIAAFQPHQAPPKKFPMLRNVCQFAVKTQLVWDLPLLYLWQMAFFHFEDCRAFTQDADNTCKFYNALDTPVNEEGMNLFTKECVAGEFLMLRELEFVKNNEPINSPKVCKQPFCFHSRFCVEKSCEENGGCYKSCWLSGTMFTGNVISVFSTLNCCRIMNSWMLNGYKWKTHPNVNLYERINL